MLSALFVFSLGLSVAVTSRAKNDEGSTKHEKSTKHDTESTRKAEASVEPPPPSSLPMSLALLGSLGPSSEYLRAGLGLRGGVHLDGTLPFYFGGLATYFFGYEKSSNDPFGSGTSSVNRKFMYLGAEAGLNLGVIKDVTLRPYLGLGLGRSSEETCSGSGSCETKAKYPLMITPGVAGFYDLGAGLFVGGDIRFLVAAGASDTGGPVLSATIGFKF
jgi:hypothetical protein